jgi:NodT family efflux transporter outer membrane factor (OMF) lipoprotein
MPTPSPDTCRHLHVFHQLACAGLLLALSGCASVPAAGPDQPPARIAAERTLAGGTADWPGEADWQRLGDAQLGALIQEGLAGSPDLALARARLRQAEALAMQAGAARLPSLDVQADASLDKQSYNTGFPKAFVPKGWQDGARIAAVLDYDIDLWGRNRAAWAAAMSDAGAAAVEARQARLALTAAIAAAYADWQHAHEERAIRRAQLTMREASARLVAQRRVQGMETLGSQRLAEAQVAAARGDLAGSEQELALGRNRIAALLGAGPDRGLSLTVPAMPELLQNRLPADATTELVARRPDIVAARLRTEAAAGRIAVARADFFPAIRLSALVGLQSLGLENVLAGDSLIGSVGPAISLPLFRGGALTGRYDGAKAGYAIAVAEYNRTVVGAYRDVADALLNRQHLEERLVQARAALTASRDAHRVAQLRYRAGLSTFLDALAVEDRALQAQLSVSATEAALRSADIALLQALGGGISPDTSETNTSDPNTSDKDRTDG